MMVVGLRRLCGPAIRFVGTWRRDDLVSQPREKWNAVVHDCNVGSPADGAAESAYSQMGNQSIAKPMPGAQAADKKEIVSPEHKKAEEKAYKDAITRIPDQKFDPWGKVR